MPDASLFDNPSPRHDLGAALRDEAITRVEQNASRFWLDCADSAIHIRPVDDRFTSDDVWETLDRWRVRPPSEPRAMGAAFQQAQRRGLIEPTPDFNPSRRPQAHKAPCRVWRRTSVMSSSAGGSPSLPKNDSGEKAPAPVGDVESTPPIEVNALHHVLAKDPAPASRGEQVNRREGKPGREVNVPSTAKRPDPARHPIMDHKGHIDPDPECALCDRRTQTEAF